MPRYSHSKRYFGTFTNSKGQEKEGYLEWSSDKGGFILRDAATKMPLTTMVYNNLHAVKTAGVKFAVTGKVEETTPTKKQETVTT